MNEAALTQQLMELLRLAEKHGLNEAYRWLERQLTERQPTPDGRRLLG